MRGFFGKIPGHGDFVDRGLPGGVTTRVDEWLQEGLAASRAALGQDWLNIYLTSPVWRFVLGEGVCGPEPWAGVMVPSVDRVGRYFPLVVAAALPKGVIPLQALTAGAGWFDGAEDVALGALADDGVEADELLGSIVALGEVPLGPAPLVADMGASALPAGGSLAMPLAYETSPAQGLLALTHRLLEARFGACYSLWWTIGSELVHPGVIACADLPEAETYGALLSDQCPAPAWSRVGGYALVKFGPAVGDVSGGILSGNEDRGTAEAQS